MSDEVETVEEDLAETREPGTVRFGITLQEGDYRRLHGIALARWRRHYARRSLPDGAVAELIARMVQRALDDVDREDEGRRVRSANARHVAAVTEPWPTGPWTQDEVDQVIADARAGHTADAIARDLRRQLPEVLELLRGFGIRAPRELRTRPPIVETRAEAER